ncbi:MAG: sporulation protein YqfD [Clostridia bacterium]|nr:sporulation protein YqfD [Clostridia bacterium]
MKIPLHDLLLGYYLFQVQGKDKTRFINLLLKTRAIASPLKNGAIAVAAIHKKRVWAAAESQNIAVFVSPLMGLPAYLGLVLARPGVIVGALVFCLLLGFGGSRVWRVDIEGNQRVSDAVIESNLASLGFGTGSAYRKADLVGLAEEYRLRFPHLSYVSIYMEGTVAKVKVRETEEGENEETGSDTPSFLVAAQDAIIHRVAVTHGTPTVSIGQVVKKGDVLVSGLVTGAHDDHLLSAEGEVIGEVQEVIFVEIPLSRVEKTNIIRKKGQFSIIFFGKCINIFTNSGKIGQRYDTIEREKIWRLPNGLPLPLSFHSVDFLLYEEEEIPLGKTEALRKAQREMGEQLSSLIQNGELLGKTETVIEKDGKWMLACRVRYTTNIAVSHPLTENAD